MLSGLTASKKGNAMRRPTMKKYCMYVVILGCLFFSSCVLTLVDYPTRVGYPPSGEFYTIEEMELGGTLSLENIKGDINIQGWEKEEIEVFAEKTISDPVKGKFRIGSRKNLEPKIDFQRFENYVTIRSQEEVDEDQIVDINYEISVPQSVNLKDINLGKGNIFISDLYGKVYVDLKNGDLSIDNFSGSLTASLGFGSFMGSFYDIRGEDEVIITSRQGDVFLYLQPNINARLECSSPDGDIFSEFEFEEDILPANKISVELGKDGALFSVTTVQGDIWIKKIKETN
jgi:hypothetical protein